VKSQGVTLTRFPAPPVNLGSDGYGYQLNTDTGARTHSLLLSLGVGLGDYRTRLASDGTSLYGGAHGYAYKVVINDSRRGGGPIYRDLLTTKK
jgi:hypothetical protein